MAVSFARLQPASAVTAITQGVAASVFTAVATMLAGIVTARYLGPAGRGELAALTTLPAFCSLVATFGLPSSLVYHARRSPAGMSSFIAAALLMSVAAGLVGAALAYAAAPFVLAELTPDQLPVARALALFTVLGLLNNVSIAALQARHEFAAYNWLRVAQPAAQLAGMLALGIGGWMTPLSAALVVLLSGLPGLLWSVRSVFPQDRAAWARWRGAIREMASYSFRAFGGELLVGVATQVDRVIVVGLFAPALMGIYVVALNLSRIVTVFPSAVAVVLFPKASGRSASEVGRVTSRAAAGTVLTVGIASLGLIAFGPWLLELFYGAEFRGASLALRLLVLEAAIASLVQIFGQAFMALDRPGLGTFQYGSGAVVAIPLLFLLAPRFGAEGAAAALLIASLARLGCTYWCFTVAMKMPAPRVFAEIGSSVAALKTAVLAALR